MANMSARLAYDTDDRRLAGSSVSVAFRENAAVVDLPLTHATADVRENLLQLNRLELAKPVALRHRAHMHDQIAAAMLANAMDRGAAEEAYTQLADDIVSATASLIVREMSDADSLQGVRWAVFALGKLGARDMTATSDLDMLIVYDCGERDVSVAMTRFSQRLIEALTYRGREGRLYEADLRLRPYGESGPIAVKATAFAHYYRQCAWTWELMALTRLRFVCGDAGFGDQILAERGSILRERSDNPDITRDVRSMRERLAEHKSASTPWDMKRAEGGLVDVDFIIQHSILKFAERTPEVIHSDISSSLLALEAYGAIRAEDCAALRRARAIQASAQQAQRATGHGRAGDVEAATDDWKSWFANRLECRSFDDVMPCLDALRREVLEIRDRHLGVLAG